MKDKIQKAFKILNKKGAYSLVYRVYVYARMNIPPLIPEWYKEYEVGGEKAYFRVSTHQELQRLTPGSIEEKVIADVLSEIRPSDTFYDIGANIGIYSRLVCQRLETGEVIAFEPLPKNIDSFRRNLSKTPIRSRLFELALSDEKSQQELILSGEGEAGQGMSRLRSKGDSSSSTLKIKTISGDEFIESNNVPRPNVIKIDVEGAEMKVIDGMDEAISDTECRVIYCEIHHDSRKGPGTGPHLADYGGSSERINEKLEKNGYSIKKLADHKSSDGEKVGHIIKAKRK